MSDFINTIDELGEKAVMNSIIDGSITEFKDDSLITVGDYAFMQCDELTTIELPNVATVGVNGFLGSGLTEVYLPSLVALGGNAFNGCGNLVEAVFPVCERLSYQPFSWCSKLQYAEFGSASFSELPALTFNGAKALTTLVIRRANGVVSLGNTNAFGETKIIKGTGYIYVPKALVEDYKVATNWVTFADQFRALEDYTIDGTITGELDETKI